MWCHLALGFGLWALVFWALGSPHTGYRLRLRRTGYRYRYRSLHGDSDLNRSTRPSRRQPLLPPAPPLDLSDRDDVNVDRNADTVLRVCGIDEADYGTMSRRKMQPMGRNAAPASAGADPSPAGPPCCTVQDLPVVLLRAWPGANSSAVPISCACLPWPCLPAPTRPRAASIELANTTHQRRSGKGDLECVFCASGFRRPNPNANWGTESSILPRSLYSPSRFFSLTRCLCAHS